MPENKSVEHITELAECWQNLSKTNYETCEKFVFFKLKKKRKNIKNEEKKEEEKQLSKTH